MYGVGELGVHAIAFHPRPSGVDTVHAAWVSATRDCDLSVGSRQLQAHQRAFKRSRKQRWRQGLNCADAHAPQAVADLAEVVGVH